MEPLYTFSTNPLRIPTLTDDRLHLPKHITWRTHSTGWWSSKCPWGWVNARNM